MFAHDEFTDTDGTLLDAHTATDGGTWTEHVSLTPGTQFAIANNRIWDNGSRSVYYHSGVPSSADYTVSADFVVLTNPDGYPGITARMDLGSETYYFVRVVGGPNQVQLAKIVNGSQTVMVSNAEDLDPGTYNIKFKLSGDQLTVFKDGIEIITHTDSAITAAGRVGVRGSQAFATSTTGTHLDNFQAANPPSPGASMTQQGKRQADFRAAGGTDTTYNGDARAAFNAQASVPSGATYNEAFILWLQAQTMSSQTEINGLMALYAQQNGAFNWSSVG